jgi:hypothetical protein
VKLNRYKITYQAMLDNDVDPACPRFVTHKRAHSAAHAREMFVDPEDPAWRILKVEQVEN